MTQILAVLLLAVFWSHPAAAIPACTAADVSAIEGAGCPASGNCTITKILDVAAGTECTFDFRGRNVTVTSSGRFNLRSAKVRLLASNLTIQSGGAAAISMAAGDLTLDLGSFTLAPGAVIDGSGTGLSGVPNTGGNVRILATENVTLGGISGSRSRIDVTGTVQGGRIDIETEGNASLNGRLLADRLAPSSAGSGGSIFVTAGGNIVAEAAGASELTAVSGATANSSGSISLSAGGSINLASNTLIDASGSRGGSVDILADQSVRMGGIRANATGSFGNGGSVLISSGLGTVIDGSTNSILLNGNTGGAGGSLTVETLFGDLEIIGGNVAAEGASPDGDGGSIEFNVAGSIRTTTGRTLSVQSLGAEGFGGSINLIATHDVTLAAQTGQQINVSGGANGGSLSIEAGGSVTLGGPASADGRSAASVGGEVVIEAGTSGAGNLTILRDLTASGGGCSLDGCGDGGTIELTACTIAIGSNGSVRVRGAGASGENTLTTRRELVIEGLLSARFALAGSTDGRNFLTRSTSGPVRFVGSGRAEPSIEEELQPLCSNSGSVGCVIPCPSCGDGRTDFPEECDDGNVANCDGCSAFCTLESCSPEEFCRDGIACLPALGCAPCDEPQAETATPSPTLTPTPSFDPSATPTPTIAPPTPTRTALPSPTSTAIASPTATATATGTATAVPSPTSAPACFGDCDLSGGVEINDIITMVNITLGSLPLDRCQVGDEDGSGTIEINEIIRAVNATLTGACL